VAAAPRLPAVGRHRRHRRRAGLAGLGAAQRPGRGPGRQRRAVRAGRAGGAGVCPGAVRHRAAKPGRAAAPAGPRSRHRPVLPGRLRAAGRAGDRADRRGLRRGAGPARDVAGDPAAARRAALAVHRGGRAGHRLAGLAGPPGQPPGRLDVAAARCASLAGGAQHPHYVPGPPAGPRQLPADRRPDPGHQLQRRHPDRDLHRLRVPGRAAARERALELRAGRPGAHQPGLSPAAPPGHGPPRYQPRHGVRHLGHAVAAGGVPGPRRGGLRDGPERPAHPGGAGRGRRPRHDPGVPHPVDRAVYGHEKAQNP
jgi:hypothetical protein